MATKTVLFFKRNISKLSDEELLTHYTKSGDTEYFGELYNRYIPLLYGLCLKYLQDEDRAQEAVMQLFEDLLPKLGNYEIKVPSEGKTELAQVGKSFNLMTGKVREQIEKLSSVNQAQRQLLGSLAHELKTPMTAIIGYADTLLTVRLSPKRQEIALDYIRNECQRLSRLSVKMLELTGLYETGEAEFVPVEVQM